jgi:hypothetical protein
VKPLKFRENPNGKLQETGDSSGPKLGFIQMEIINKERLVISIDTVSP